MAGWPPDFHTQLLLALVQLGSGPHVPSTLLLLYFFVSEVPPLFSAQLNALTIQSLLSGLFQKAFPESCSGLVCLSFSP